MNAWWAQSRAEVRMTLRRGETLLLTVGIPVLLLVFFSLTKVASTPTKSRVDFVAPGILALCVLSTSLVALSIATGFERGYGVLRRLYVTPIGTRRLIGAKIAGVLVTEALQVIVLTLVAFTLTWRPRGGAIGGFEVAALAGARLGGLRRDRSGPRRTFARRGQSRRQQRALPRLVVALGHRHSTDVAATASSDASRSRCRPARWPRDCTESSARAAAPTGADWLVLGIWALARTARRGAHLPLRLGAQSGDPLHQHVLRDRAEVDLLDDALGADERGLGDRGELEYSGRHRVVRDRRRSGT